MTPSEACFALLKSFEQGPDGDFAATPYPCPAGHPTVGWGHRVLPSDHFTFPLTAEQADALLRHDAARIGDFIGRLIQVPVTQSMTDALISLAFNIGNGALAGSTLRAQLNAGCYQAAADQFLVWNKAKDPKTGQRRPMPGLQRRRDAERALFLRDGLPTFHGGRQP